MEGTSDTGGRRPHVVVWVLAALTAAPALVAAAMSVGVGWEPDGDYAAIEVRVRDVLSSHPPLSGAYSRVGGNHPGPALFEVLAGPYRLAGGRPWGLFLGAALVNALAMALTVRILGRGGRVWPAAAGAVLTLLCAWGMGADHLRDPWNPRLAVFPFLLGVVASWAVALGSRRALPVAIAALSFSLQAHVGYAVLVAVLCAWCAWGVWRHRSALARWRPWLLLTGGVVVAMWLLPVGEQLFGPGPGNLGVILAGAAGDGDPARGWAGVSEAVLPQLGPYPRWFRPAYNAAFEPGAASGLPLPPLGLIAFVAGGAVALRRRRVDQAVLVLMTLTLWLAAAVSVARITGVPASYLYRWMRPLGGLLWLAALWPLADALTAAVRRRWPGRVDVGPVASSVAAVGVVLVVSGFVTVDQVRTPVFGDYREAYAQTEVLAREAVRVAEERAEPGDVIEVRPRGAVIFDAPSVVTALERAGFPTVVDQSDGTVWGRHRLPGEGREPRWTMVVTTADAPTAQEDHPGLTFGSWVDLLTPAQRRELESLRPLEDHCADQEGEEREPSCRRRDDLAFRDRHVNLLFGPADDG